MNALAAQLKSRLKLTPQQSGVGPIGLHFAEEQAHAVQLRRLGSGRYCQRAWASVSYRDTRQESLGNATLLKHLIDKLLSRANFRGRSVVTALPPEMVRIMSLNYQLSGGISDGEAIVSLLKNRLDGALADHVIDYVPVRGDEKAREKVALVTISQRSQVLGFLDALEHAKLKVQDLEVGPSAINRLFSLLPAPAGARGNYLIINFGAERSYLTLISGRRLLMDKEIDFGANLLIQHLARDLDTSLEMASDMVIREGLVQQVNRPFGATQELTGDDLNPVVEILRPIFSGLVEEVRRACLYAASESQGETVEQVYAFGSIARWPGASELLADLTKLPVATSLPLTAIFDSDDASAATEAYSGVGPDLAIATGLALRGLTEDA